MQITQEKFNELFHKLNIAQSSASKLESILADLGVTIAKPLIINGVECPQPQREPLEPGEEYFIADPTSAARYFGEFIWDDDPQDMKWLERGLIYLNKEDAIKVATARLMPLKYAQTMKIPELNEGERYAGIVIDSATGQPTHHLILIPHQPETHLTWDEAIAWAASIGVELPTRQESALLYANLKPHFKGAWYWSSEQHASNKDCAWRQHFDDGYQDDGHKDEKSYARAIRRVPITQGRHGHHR